MTEAPKRILAFETGARSWHLPTERMPPSIEATPYVRADLYERAVQALRTARGGILGAPNAVPVAVSLPAIEAALDEADGLDALAAPPNA